MTKFTPLQEAKKILLEYGENQSELIIAFDFDDANNSSRRFFGSVFDLWKDYYHDLCYVPRYNDAYVFNVLIQDKDNKDILRLSNEEIAKNKFSFCELMKILCFYPDNKNF